MNEHKLNNELNNLKQFKEFDVENEWAHFLDRVDVTKQIESNTQTQDSSKSFPAKLVRLPRYFAALAAGLLILIISTIAFLNVQKEEPTIVQETPNLIKQLETPKELTPPPVVEEQEQEHDEVQEQTQAKEEIAAISPVKADYKRMRADEMFTFEDGSTITAIAETIIKLPDSFEEASDRLINFSSGSAVFDVAENPEKPFKVLTNNAGISVLGTSFRLIKDGFNNTLKTLTGEVKFYSIADESISTIVSQGQEFTFDGKEMVNTKKDIEVKIPEEPAPVIEKPEEPAPVVEKPEEPAHVVEKPDMSKYDLKSLHNSWSTFYGDFVKFKLKDIEKDVLNASFEIPAAYVTTGPGENVTKALEILKQEFEVDVEKLDDCDHCYKINSIKAKN